MNKIKRISAFLLIASLMTALSSLRASAGESTTEVGKYRLNVSCSNNLASYSITERGSATNPFGYGILRYTKYGQYHTMHITGSSWLSYWSARHSDTSPGVHFYEATTFGYGGHVTAYN